MVTESVGHFVDAEGNEIWICPQCNKPDDGSPMIGCDAGCKDYNNLSQISKQYVLRCLCAKFDKEILKIGIMGAI